MYLSICLSVYLPVYLSIDLSIDLSFYLSFYLSIYLSICKLENEAILQDTLEICRLKAEKRSPPAKHPSNLEVDNIKNAAFLRDFLNLWSWQHQRRSNSARLQTKMESWVQSLQPRANAFRDFGHSIYLKYRACHEKVRLGHMKCSACHAKSS